MFALYLGIRQYLVGPLHPVRVDAAGPQIQDRLLVEKLAYRTRPPRRGEIVVFNSLCL